MVVNLINLLQVHEMLTVTSPPLKKFQQELLIKARSIPRIHKKFYLILIIKKDRQEMPFHAQGYRLVSMNLSGSVITTLKLIVVNLIPC